MSEITFSADYSGRIDGERVAWTYRAYNEEGAPYVLVLHDDDGLSTIIQAPTEFLDGVADEDVDRENAIGWVQRLTELVHKAQVLDRIVDIVSSAPTFDIAMANDVLDALKGFEVGPDQDAEEGGCTVIAKLWLPGDDDDDVFTVDELTDSETDSVWVDCDGDHYKHIDGEWYISEVDGPWVPVSTFPVIGDTLTDYGPYTAVGA